MKVVSRPAWPATAEEAEAMQRALRSRLDLAGPGPLHPTTVAGVDVA